MEREDFQNIINVLGVKNIILYFVIINLLGFVIMFADKKKAEKGKWRVPEKTLFIITLLGGGIGTNIGMYKFRHKTKKARFYIGFPTILVIEVILIVYFLLKAYVI